MENYVSNAVIAKSDYSNKAFDNIILPYKTGDLQGEYDEKWLDLLEAERILVKDDVAIYPLYQTCDAYLQSGKFTGFEWPDMNFYDTYTRYWTVRLLAQ